MPLPIFDAESDIPELFRPEYEEKDGKWHPKVPDVTNLTSALESERARAREEERKRKDAEKRAAELQRATEAKGKGISDEELDRLRAEDAAKRKEEVEPLQQRLADAEARLRAYQLTNPVKDAYLAAGMYPDEWEERSERILKRYDLSDGGTSVVVKDEQGKLSTETLEQSVAKYREKYPRAFQADVGGGGGATRSTARTGGTVDVVKTKAQTGAYLPV